MKRTATIFLTTIYLLSLVGIGVNSFYCCGKLASVTIVYGTPDNTNPEIGAKKKCCKHELKSFKVKDTHVATGSFYFDHPLLTAILPSSNGWALAGLIKEQPLTIAYQSNAPPGRADVPIYTLNCAYRI